MEPKDHSTHARVGIEAPVGYGIFAAQRIVSPSLRSYRSGGRVAVQTLPLDCALEDDAGSGRDHAGSDISRRAGTR